MPVFYDIVNTIVVFKPHKNESLISLKYFKNFWAKTCFFTNHALNIKRTTTKNKIDLI